MDRPVEDTLKYGLVPPVVMEIPGITVGGGYAGTSGESSSYKHGFFNHTLNNVETVLANGDVVTCSEKEKSDLLRVCGNYRRDWFSMYFACNWCSSMAKSCSDNGEL